MLVTFMQKSIDLSNIKERDISIIDIAHSLSLLCRFNGHCSGFYSVAQHSVLMSDLMHDDHGAKCALMHDAAEAYIGDITTPLKIKLKDIDEIEANILKVIFTTFKINMTATRKAEIEKKDARLLITEMNQICRKRPPIKWHNPPKPYDIRIEYWPWQKAYNEFMTRANRLWGG